MRRWRAVAHGATVAGEPVEVDGIPFEPGAWQVFLDGELLGVVERRTHLGGFGQRKTRWVALSCVGRSEHPTRTQALGRLVADHRPGPVVPADPYEGLATVGPDVRGQDWRYQRKKWTNNPIPQVDGS